SCCLAASLPCSSGGSFSPTAIRGICTELACACPLLLTRRHLQPQALECSGDLDLAGQPRVLLDMRAELEHRGFRGVLCRQAAEPFRVDHVDHAGGAGAGAAAVGIDADDATAHRALHDRLPLGDVDGAFPAVGLLEDDLGHAIPYALRKSFTATRSSASLLGSSRAPWAMSCLDSMNSGARLIASTAISCPS